MFEFIRRKFDEALMAACEPLVEPLLNFGKSIYKSMEAIAAMGTKPRGERETPLFHRCQIDPRAALGPLAHVKLVHSSELEKLQRFPRYQDFTGVFLAEHYIRCREMQKGAADTETFMRADKRLREIDHEGSINYGLRAVTVPGSLIKRIVEIDVGDVKWDRTTMVPKEGEVCDGKLLVTTRLLERTVDVSFSCPSRVYHAEEIARLKAQMAAVAPEHRSFSEEARRALEPVLFISHRWETIDHPDPEGRQLDRLRELKNCYLVYDYTSFPQPRRTPSEEKVFQEIMNHMNFLLDRVVVLQSPDHLERGWLVFEYLVSAIGQGIACDEVAHPDFVELHDWCNTRAPIPHNLIRNSYESMQSNYINGKILKLITKVAPLFRASKFSLATDREEVTKRMVSFLKQRLPPKMEYMQGLGECESIPWTDEEIDAIFCGRVDFQEEFTGSLKRHETHVPRDLANASAKNYMVDRMTACDVLDDWLHKRTRI
jgi:hypothetical protein